MQNDQAKAYTQTLQVQDEHAHWFDFTSEKQLQNLSDLDVILMRKDPPFDLQYIYATYILEFAQSQGKKPLVVNKPQSLRDANEKMFALNFAQCITSTLVSRNPSQLKEFAKRERDVIIKPLDGMGGASIFRIKSNDANTNVIIETVTNFGQEFVMMQRFIPEISQGDKRILLINGEPVAYALARIPPEGENRGNIAAGGSGVGIKLSDRDYFLCEQIKPMLQAKGLMFVGLDVIGDFITEINVTSPTCIRELDKQFDLNISGMLFDAIVKQRT